MENFDLNKLREEASKKEGVELTKGERITELKEKISELEKAEEPLSLYEVFIAMSPDDQQREVERIEKNRDLEPGTYSIEQRKQELERHKNDPSLKHIRLERYKTELEELENSSLG